MVYSASETTHLQADVLVAYLTHCAYFSFLGAKSVHPGYSPNELTLGRATHLAFEVDDLGATIQHLHTQGVEIVGGPRPRVDGVQQLYICDPDGYVIELFV